MNKKKLKILILGFNDTRIIGNAYSIWKNISTELFDKRLIILENRYPKDGYESIYDCTSIIGKIRKRILRYIQKIRLIFKIKSYFKFDNIEYSNHHFSIRSCNPISAKTILKKYRNFNPDIIYLSWSSTLVSPKVLKELYDKTKATIVFYFIDEQYLSGGCHFPIDCKGFTKECIDCPVLSVGKELAHLQMRESLNYYKDIPKIIHATLFDCKKCKESPLFKDAKFLKPIVSIPYTKRYDRKSSREKFGLKDEYVILAGAQSVHTERKGFKYAIKAINKFSEQHKNICFLLLGDNKNKEEISNLISKDVKLIMPGFLNIDDLFKAFCASDCHLSSTIADSGPMMVNYSITLGCPVVAFNIGSAMDLVKHKKTGYIAEYRNSDSLYNGLEYLYSLTGEERIIMQEECLNLVKQFEDNHLWEKELYEMCIKK